MRAAGFGLSVPGRGRGVGGVAAGVVGGLLTPQPLTRPFGPAAPTSRQPTTGKAVKVTGHPLPQRLRVSDPQVSQLLMGPFQLLLSLADGLKQLLLDGRRTSRAAGTAIELRQRRLSTGKNLVGPPITGQRLRHRLGYGSQFSKPLTAARPGSLQPGLRLASLRRPGVPQYPALPLGKLWRGRQPTTPAPPRCTTRQPTTGRAAKVTGHLLPLRRRVSDLQRRALGSRGRGPVGFGRLDLWLALDEIMALGGGPRQVAGR